MIFEYQLFSTLTMYSNRDYIDTEPQEAKPH